MKKSKYGMSTFIGETLIGLPYPVFYDPHYCILNNKSPVSLITGSPGSGKTFFGLTLASHASILGKTNFILDPKGDFVALKQMENVGEINKVQIWSVVGSGGVIADENVGMLDPISFTDNIHENTALTVDIIRNLVGEITAKQKTELIPIIRDVAESSNPSFMRVVQKLLQNRNDEIRALGFSLETLLKVPLAKLLVSNKRIKSKKFKLGEGTTVANLMGLTLPGSTTNKEDYSASEAVSVCIVGLLTASVLNLMREIPKSKFKTLIIDEAWALMGTKAGKDMIQQVALLGRSLNMAAILLTQSPSHLEVENGPDLETTISTRFAFKNTNSKDNLKTVQAMKLPENESWDELIPSLNTGECLMQDSNGNKTFIHVMAQDNWEKLFDTSPASVLGK